MYGSNDGPERRLRAGACSDSDAYQRADRNAYADSADEYPGGCGASFRVQYTIAHKGAYLTSNPGANFYAQTNAYTRVA